MGVVWNELGCDGVGWGWNEMRWVGVWMGMSEAGLGWVCLLSLCVCICVCPAELVLVVSGGCIVELIEFHVVCVGRVLPRQWV